MEIDVHNFECGVLLLLRRSIEPRHGAYRALDPHCLKGSAAGRAAGSG